MCPASDGRRRTRREHQPDAELLHRPRPGDEVTTAIQKDLTARGFTGTLGPDSATPTFVDAKVIAQDKWMWDITMYPLEVKIDVVTPKTGALLASGRSYHTSLVRKSPDEMVHEVFDKIFGMAPAK
jgi:hypothetical protein